MKKKIIPCVNKYVSDKDIPLELKKYNGIKYESREDLFQELDSKIEIINNQINTFNEEKIEAKIDDSSVGSTKHNSRNYNSAESLIDKAKDFEDIGEYDRVLKQYEKVLEKEPDNFKAIYNKVIILERIKRFSKALVTIENAIDIEPKNTDVWYHKACILEKLERYDEALEAFNTDLYLDDRDIRSWTGKANILPNLEEYEEAIGCYTYILKLDSRNTDALNKRKIVQKQLEESSEKQKLQGYYFISKWGSKGSADGQFFNPQGIAIYSDKIIYVCDVSQNRIQKFDSNGNFITKWGKEGTGDGQFNSPRDITIEPSTGYVYVSDGINHRIQKFDSNGDFYNKMGIKRFRQRKI